MLDNDFLGNNILRKPVFGIEFIWQLEDCYEEKNLNKFSSLVSHDFKKDQFFLMDHIAQEFNEYEQLKLFVHLRSKHLDPDAKIYAYEVCWSKRCKRYQSIFLENNSGSATIVLKRFKQDDLSYFLLYDILGDNPFF